MLRHALDACCVIMGSQTHQMTIMAASVGSALLYGITSTSMAFLNKVVLDVYNYDLPTFIMVAQMVVTMIIIKSLELCGFLQLQSLTFNNLKQFSGPCFFYSLNGVLSLAALGSMNLTMYSVVKRNGPLCTLLLSILILRKGLPGPKVILGVLMMSVGCIIAASGDITFDLEAYAFGFGSVISQSLYLLLLQRLSENFSTPDTLFMNSVLGFPVLSVIALMTGEFPRALAFPGYNNIGFIVTFSVLLIMGSFLNFTLFLCNSNNSALTTSVVGTLKSVVQTTMGMFTFGGVVINVAMVSGVFINLSGGIVYTYAKYLETKSVKAMKKVHSEAIIRENSTIVDMEDNSEKSDGPLQSNGQTTLIHLHHHTESSEPTS